MIALILATAGSATASDVALNGGMSIIDGTFITSVFMGIACVFGSVTTLVGVILWGRRFLNKHDAELRTKIANELQARVINDPLNVKSINDCISVKECNRRMAEMDARICKVEQNLTLGIQGIIAKLDAMDSKSEDRAEKLHRRVDVISDRTSQMMGEINMIKDKMFKRK